jgi:hypothetical protein
MPDLDKSHQIPSAAFDDGAEETRDARVAGPATQVAAFQDDEDIGRLLQPPRGTAVEGYHGSPEVGRGYDKKDVAAFDDVEELGRLISPATATGAKSYHGVDVGRGRQEGAAATAEEVLFWEVLDEPSLPGGYTWGEVTPTGTGPSVVSAARAGPSTVRVTFSAALRNHPYKGEVLNPDSYVLEEASTLRRLFIVLVQRASDTEVDLVTEELADVPRSYRLTVKNVQGVNGDPVGAGGGTTQVTFVSTVAPYNTFSEAHFYYGMKTGLNSDTATDIEPDVSGPVLTAVDPIAGAGFADAETNIILRITDPESGVNHDSVEIDIWRGAPQPVEPVWRGGSGAQPGYAVTETPIAGGYEYEIDPNVDLPDGKIITVYGRASNLFVTYPLPLDDSYWFKVFDKYGFIVTTQTGDYELSLVFGAAMEVTGGPGALLADPATYELEALGAGLPAGVFYPSGVNVISPTLVRLTVPLITKGQLYAITVVQDIRLQIGDSALGAISEFSGNPSLPRVSQVVPTGSRTVEVSFNRDLQDNADLVNPGAYAFTGGLRAETVERVAANKVRLTLNRLMERRRTYLLSVKANP